ncbi:MAG TPA: hypothetical protein VFU21_23765 [Kofleriaceae bacterium]|nr:hypothetical protein [Kofleriaceae bacterium]
MRPIIAVMVVSLVAACPTGCGRYVAAPAPTAPAASQSPAPVEAHPKPREATDEERQLYAEREMQSAGLEKFTGGDAVVTVLVVVLLVIIILILLKKI